MAGLTRLVISSALARGTPLDGYLGYGSPRVVRHPYTREPWILFTAWKDIAGRVREVWAAPIADELSFEVDLKRSKKISSGSELGVVGLNTVDAFYDYYNDRWLIFSTVYGGEQRRFALISLDPDFSKVETTIVEAPLTWGMQASPAYHMKMIRPSRALEDSASKDPLWR